MLNILIESIKKQTHVETKKRYLDVSFQIVESDGPESDTAKVVFTKKLAFPLYTKLVDIKKELKKQLANYKSELKGAEKRAKLDKEDKNADEIINKLEGKTL